MHIKQIVLDGFKSYATRTVSACWDPKFNAITGLNGSGKSNILDAICFVLVYTLQQVSEWDQELKTIPCVHAFEPFCSKIKKFRKKRQIARSHFDEISKSDLQTTFFENGKIKSQFCCFFFGFYSFVYQIFNN